MADCMMFPKDWHDFIKDYSFLDSKQVYTNGSELIQVFRVIQLIEHLLKEQEYKDRMFHALEDDWKRLKELLKEQENASKRNPVIVCPHCGKRVK